MGLQTVLDSMSYKPTYSFEVEGQFLAITMHTHDSRPDEPTPLSIPVHFPIPDWPHSDWEWKEWLRAKIHWCELHESDEWLRFDGELFHDPHETAMIR